MADEPGTWRGTTAEQRIAPRRRALLGAGFALLAEGGQEAVTVRGVCAHGGLSPRYFYESFAGTEELVVAVYDEVREEGTARALAAVAAAEETAEAKTRAALAALVGFLAEDRRRLRVLLGDREGGALAARRAAGVRAGAEVMAGLAARFYGLPPEDPLLRSTAFLLTGGIVQLIRSWDEGHLDLTADELVEHATTLVVGTSRGAGRGRRSTP